MMKINLEMVFFVPASSLSWVAIGSHDYQQWLRAQTQQLSQEWLPLQQSPTELAFPLLGPHTPNPNSLSMSTREVEQEITPVTRTDSLTLPR